LPAKVISLKASRASTGTKRQKDRPEKAGGGPEKQNMAGQDGCVSGLISGKIPDHRPKKGVQSGNCVTAYASVHGFSPVENGEAFEEAKEIEQ